MTPALTYMSAFPYPVRQPCKVWRKVFLLCGLLRWETAGANRKRVAEAVAKGRNPWWLHTRSWSNASESTLLEPERGMRLSARVRGALWKLFCDARRQLLDGRSDPRVSEIHLKQVYRKLLLSCFEGLGGWSFGNAFVRWQQWHGRYGVVTCS